MKATLTNPNHSITIVAYHYIRDTHGTPFPNIKALSLEAFQAQLDYFQANYVIVSLDACVQALRTDTLMPKNALMLTFDDGLIDHYTTVLPHLQKRNLNASFFPSTQPIVESVVLDVHKIHFILAAATDIHELLLELFHRIDKYKSRYSLLSKQEYYAHYAHPGMFDSAEVVLFKTLLQRALPENVRRSIVRDLFIKYVTRDEKTFANDLYLNREQLKTMVEHGMYVGVHGYTHAWMTELAPEEQQLEIDRSLCLLSEIGAPTSHWAISYPHGAYNSSLLKILKETNCTLGLTTEKGVATLSRKTALILPRLDTNHLPRS